jgi:CubicO group peptidase (beta-lactamase class C family)
MFLTVSALAIAVGHDPERYDQSHVSPVISAEGHESYVAHKERTLRKTLAGQQAKAEQGNAEQAAPPAASVISDRLRQYVSRPGDRRCGDTGSHARSALPQTEDRRAHDHDPDRWPPDTFTTGNGWGLGWCIVREPQGITAMLSPGTFGHGGAYGTQAWIDPRKKLVYILMVQRANFPNSDASEVRKGFQAASWAFSNLQGN